MNISQRVLFIGLTFKSGSTLTKSLEATIGFDLWTKTVEIDDKKVKITFDYFLKF